MKDRRERWRPAAEGAALGLGIWLLEAMLAAAAAAGAGGLEVLASAVDELCAWGLAYAAVGATLGLLAPVHLRWIVALAGWLVLVALADPGVVPRSVPAMAVIAASGLLRLLPARGRLLGLAILPLLLAGALWPEPTPPADGRPGAGPDIVLVVVDTLRADHVGAWGYPRDTTPHLDRLAAEASRYSEAWSTASWTLPAHASLFTGLAPGEHGAHAGTARLPAGPPTLAERLDARGYRTVGLSANGWVSPGTGLERGFERFVFLGDRGFASQLLLPLVFDRPEDLGGRAIVDRALAEVDAAGDEPVFLFLNLLEAHEPFGTVPDDWRSRFADEPLDPTLGRTWLRDMPRSWCTCHKDAGELRCEDGLYKADAERVRAVIDRYDAGVAYDDHLLGVLREGLEARGRWEDAVVVVTSDHGEHLGEEGGRLGHMVWLTEALLRVPLVVKDPGQAPGLVDTTVDLAWLGRWLQARAEGQRLPPSGQAAAESHPHPEETLDAWQAIYACDFTPAGTERRGVVQRGRLDVVEGAVAPAPGGRDLDPATEEALRGLGYVE